MLVKFFGGSKDGVEREVNTLQPNLTVVSMLYHPYCPIVDQEIYDLKEDGNLYVRQQSGQPCQACCKARNDKIDAYEKRNQEIALHRQVCNCDYCGFEGYND